MKVWKKWMAALLTAAILLSGMGTGTMGYGAGSQYAKAEVLEDIQAEALDDDQTEAPIDDQREALADCQAAGGLITGFAEFDLMEHAMYVPYENRPEEWELISAMPETLGVYLDGGDEVSQIPVTWYCLGDEYESAEDSFVQYCPKWDEGLYSLQEGLAVSTDAPFITVFFTWTETDGGEGYTLLGDNDPVNDCANMKTCYYWLRENTSFNRAVICGILANLQTECDFQSDLKDGKAYGLIQWTMEDKDGRYQGLLTYCKNNNLDYRTIEGQLAYMMYEIINKKEGNGYGGISDFYGTLKSVDNCELGSVYAAYLFARCYERCYINYYLKRQNLARLYWEYFTASRYVTQVTKTQSGIEFPAEIGTGDIYKFSGKVTFNYPITRIKAGVAVYEDYAATKGSLNGTERTALSNVHSAEWLSEPAVVTVTPDTEGYNLGKISQTLSFSGLTVGKTYIFYMYAMVKGTGRTLLEQRFTVKKGNVYTPVTDTGGDTLETANAPSAPTLKASMKSTGVKLTWSGVKDASSYIIYRKTASGSYKTLTSRSSSSRSYTDTSAKGGVLYTYAVAASNEAWITKKRTVTLPFINPIQPKAANDQKAIKLSWTTIDNVTGYYIYRKNSGGSYEKIGSCGPTVKTYSDTNVTSGETYVYSVVGYYQGKSVYAGVKKGRRIMRLRTISPTISNKSGGIHISWSKVEGATEYKLYRAAEGGTLTLLKTISSTEARSYTDEQVVRDNGAMYYYGVRAVNGSSLGYLQGKGYYRVTEVQMSGLVNKAGLSFVVKWLTNNHASGYQVQYASNSSMTKNKKTLLVTGKNSAEKTVSKLTKGSKYYVRVRAYLEESGKKYYSAWCKTGSVVINK